LSSSIKFTLDAVWWLKCIVILEGSCYHRPAVTVSSCNPHSRSCSANIAKQQACRSGSYRRDGPNRPPIHTWNGLRPKTYRWKRFGVPA